MENREARWKTLVLLSTIALTLSGCSGGEPANLTPASFSVTPPKQDPQSKQIAFEGIATKTETNWGPANLMLNLTSDREGKRVLANTVIEPVRDGDKYAFSAQFPPPKAKGKYYFHWTLYGEPVPGKDGLGSVPATEPGVVEFETY